MRHFFRVIGSFAVSCLLSLFASIPVVAQGYGTISGTVTDASGAVVPGAEVTATQATTGLTLRTTTSAEGTYVFPSLAPSVYDISVSHVGFAAYSEKGLQVGADAALTAT